LILRIFIVSVLLISSVSLFSQTWQQTSFTPKGSGVTDLVVRQSNGHIFVTTGSFNWPNGDSGGVRRSTNNGNSWDNVFDAFIGRTIIDGADGNLYASIWPFPLDEGLYRSTNNGNNWNLLTTVPSGNNIFSITINTTTSPNTIFAGTRQGVLRSTNNGTSFAFSNSGIPSNSWVRDLEADSGGYIAAATTNGLFISTNNGNSWNQSSGFAPGDTIVKLIIDYDIATRGANTRLLAGSDDGNLYESFRNAKYTTAVLLAVFDGEFSGLYIAYLESQNMKVHGVSHFPKNNMGGGFQISTNDGANWTQNNNGLPNSNTSALSGFRLTASIRYHTGLFNNMNGGAKVYYLDYDVSIKQISSQVPEKYKLHQNYPNPFNPSTRIRFDLPSTGLTTLKIYNSLGKEVATLLNSKLSAGTYEYEWSASRLPSGIYFYKLMTNDFSSTKILVLLK
jgi:hypothetical protein